MLKISQHLQHDLRCLITYCYKMTTVRSVGSVSASLQLHQRNVLLRDCTFCRIASKMRSFSSSACLNSSFFISFCSNFFCDSCSLNFTLCAMTTTPAIISSAIADGPQDVLYQLKSCQFVHVNVCRKSHLKRLAVDEWASRSLKVTDNGAIQ